MVELLFADLLLQHPEVQEALQILEKSSSSYGTAAADKLKEDDLLRAIEHMEGLGRGVGLRRCALLKIRLLFWARAQGYCKRGFGGRAN